MQMSLKDHLQLSRMRLLLRTKKQPQQHVWLAGSKKGVADSMVVTTRDGEVVTVDLKTGLNSVPEQYREDVAEQLEALRSLATVALNNVTRRR